MLAWGLGRECIRDGPPVEQPDASIYRMRHGLAHSISTQRDLRWLHRNAPLINSAYPVQLAAVA
jgi:hypothetical protein